MNFVIDTTITMGVVVTVLIAVIGWVAAGRKATASRLENHEARLAAAEQTLGGMPRAEDIHRLSLSLEQIRGDMKMISANMQVNAELMRRQEVVVTRVEEFLLREKAA